MKLRGELGEHFVVTRGLDKCLAVYPESAWKVIEEKLTQGPTSSSRKAQLYFKSCALDCDMDSQGRVVIPQKLREFAGLNREAIIVGVIDHAEIWDAQRWKDYSEQLDTIDMMGIMDQMGI